MEEKLLYPTVERWLQNKGGKGCFYACSNRGKSFARPDVVGIHHVGGDLATTYELIAVEVKTDEGFFKSISQAAGYSIFAHRCYLADYRPNGKDFTNEETEIALSLGVGLLIMSQQSQLPEERLSAPPRTVRQRFLLQMLESMGYSECVLCRGVFKGTYKDGVKRADRKNIKSMLQKALDENKGYLFWSAGSVAMKASAGDSESNTARRYLCPDCIANVIGPIISD